MAIQQKQNRSAARRNTLGTFSISALTAIVSSVTAGTVLAQQQIPEEITVTGSRIQRNVGFESPAPITALDASELRMFEPGLGVSQQLANLPQFFNNVSSDDIAGRVGGDVGQSQLNMRGMGGERTLVLLDGLRVVPSDSRSSVSVDYLPSPLIKRTDIVTGGASAAYGSGALTGVTNFIIDRAFTGFKYSVRGGMNEFNGDGQNTRFTAAWGRDFLDERLHLVSSVEVRNNREFRRGRPDAFEVEWDTFNGYVTNPAWVTWRAANPTAPATQAPVPLRLTAPYVTSTAWTSTGLIRQTGFTYDRYMFTEDGKGVQQFQTAGCNYVSLPGGSGTQQNMSCDPGQYQYQLFRKGRYIEDRARLGVALQTGFLGADFQLNDSTKLWGHALYGRTRNRSAPTQTGQHEGASFLTVFSGNPYLPAQVQQAMTAQNRASIRVDQNGFSDTPWGYQERPDVTNYMYSITGGFDSELWGDWKLRGSYTDGYAKKHSVMNNWERNDRFFMAHDAVRDPETGNIVCRIQMIARDFQRKGRNLEEELHQWALKNTSVYPTEGILPYDKPAPVPYPFAVDSIDGTIKDCVPVNMFGKGNQSEAAMRYIFSSRNKTADSVQKQKFAEIVANGSLFEGWAGTVSGAVGVTYREESIDQRVIDQAIDLLGPAFNVTLPDGTVVMRGITPSVQGGGANLHRFSAQPTYGGGFDVKEVFAETIVPLYDAADGPQYAELNLSARNADYSRAGQVVVWKAGLSFQVLQDLRLRGTYSHDMREGSFRELFTQQGGGATPTDPEPTRDTPTSPASRDRSYTITTLAGGNVNIEPEEADTTVLGFVYQPSFIEGLQFSLDHYDVKLDPSIVQYTVQQIIDQCYQNGTFCDRIDRDAGTNLITMVRNLYVNSDKARVSGWDTELSYRFEPDFLASMSESMSLRLVGGYMDENSITPLGGVTIERAGQSDTPKEMVTIMGNYNFGNFGVNVVQTWTGSTTRNNQWVEGVDVDSNNVPSWHNTNLGLSWTGDSKLFGAWNASLNITNVFNRDPIQRGLTTVGDEIGRRYSIGFEAEF